MTTLVEQIQQGLEAAFQQQLADYKSKNTAAKDQLIWDGATLTAKQEAWVRWVDNNGKINCNGVDKTPTELSQLETVLNKKCSELESNINGTFTGRLLKGFADIQYLYLNVVDSDNAVKVVELTMKIRPTVSIEAANIYHFDDETNNKVEENYKNKLKLKNQSNEPTIAVTRLKKSDKSLAENIVDLQAHLLNQTKLKPEEEQDVFNERFQAEAFVEQSSPATPGNSSPVNELEDEKEKTIRPKTKRARTNSQGELIFESVHDESLFEDNYNHSDKHIMPSQKKPQIVVAPTNVGSLKYYIYEHKNTIILSTVTTVASAAVFTTLYFTLESVLPSAMVIACAAFAALIPIVIAAAVYFEFKPSWFKSDATKLKTVTCNDHPLKEIELENHKHPLNSFNHHSQYFYQPDRAHRANSVSSSDTEYSAPDSATQNVVTYLRKAKSEIENSTWFESDTLTPEEITKFNDTFTMKDYRELLADTADEAENMILQEMKPVTTNRVNL